MYYMRVGDMTGQKKEEYWDVYTEDRIRTGRLHRRGDRMKEV